MIFYITILGAGAVGLEYIIQEIERTRAACLEKLFDMDEKLGMLVEKKKWTGRQDPAALNVRFRDSGNHIQKFS